MPKGGASFALSIERLEGSTKEGSHTDDVTFGSGHGTRTDYSYRDRHCETEPGSPTRYIGWLPTIEVFLPNVNHTYTRTHFGSRVCRVHQTDTVLVHTEHKIVPAANAA